MGIVPIFIKKFFVMSDTMVKIILLVTASALFPMIGFWLDLRARRKKNEKGEKNSVE